MPRTLLASVIILLCSSASAFATTRAEHGVFFHLRTTDARLRTLVGQGIELSPTFRDLVDRLVGSDVIVHLVCDPWAPSHIDGRLTFAVQAGGYRHVIVRLKPQRSRRHLLALLGHELKHAVEVAESPSIVSAASLAREYSVLGYVQRWSVSGVTFDTAGAVDAGHRVLSEVLSSKRAGRRVLTMAELGTGTELAP